MPSLDKDATRALMLFVRNFTDLVEKNLSSIHGTMRETVDGVMQGITDISAKSAQQSRSDTKASPQQDQELQEYLTRMMGALSRDDVISQRIQHVTQSVNALQVSLTYILTDFETRCRGQELARFIRDLKTFVLSTYTMEEERETFYQVFPEDRPKRRKSS